MRHRMFSKRAVFVVVFVDGFVRAASGQTKPPDLHRALVDQYCVVCHNTRQSTAGVTLQGVDLNNTHGNAALLEKVLRKVKGGQMPPAGMPRPDTPAMTEFGAWL